MDYENIKKIYEGFSDEEKQRFAELGKNTAGVQEFAQQYRNEGGFNQTLSTPTPTTPQPTPAPSAPAPQETPQSQSSASYGMDKQFDPNETLDQSKFTNPNAQVIVQEGTAKQTWRPDYALESDARDAEMVNNLNSYKTTNPEFFRDRETFNQAFEYHKRSSDRQRALLDSYRKRQEAEKGVSGYQDGNSVYEGMQNGDLTKDQMEILKSQYPEIYQQYLKKSKEVEDLRIVNKTVPNDITNTTDLIQSLMTKLNIQPGDPYQIHENMLNALEKYGVMKNTEELDRMKMKIQDTYKSIEDITQRIEAEGTGNASASLINARITKATRGLLTQVEGYQRNYTNLLNERSQALAIAQADTNALISQTHEDQRIFENKLRALGFSKDLMAFETPEQKRQRELQYKKEEANLQNTLTDLSVSDPTTLRNNLKNTLQSYYKSYGSIIQRPIDMVVDDVLRQAKREGISVAEALKKNFVVPLQGKPEYKMLMNKAFGISNEVKDRKIVNIGGKSYEYDPQTGQYTLPQIVDWGDFTSYQITGRANRHNNPTAMTTDVAKSLGMVEWVDYVKGDSFANGKYYTAKILGNAIETTLNAFDKTASDPNKSIFYTGKNQQRWTYIWMSDEEWLSLSKEEKIWVIQKMYNHEEARDKRNFWAFWYSAGSWGGYRTDRGNLYRAYLYENKSPSAWQLKGRNLTFDQFTQEAHAYQEASWEMVETKEQKTEITNLRKEFNNLPEIKNFKTIQQSYNTVKSASNNASPAGDLSLIFAYMKILDPNSTVREGEFATAQNAGSINDKIWNLYNRVNKGTRLTPEQRKDFVKGAGDLYNESAKIYNSKLGEYKSYVVAWGDARRIGIEAIIEPTSLTATADEVGKRLKKIGSQASSWGGSVTTELSWGIMGLAPDDLSYIVW